MIVLEDIDRVFEVGEEEVRALDRVSLDIEAGEYLSIMGPSGSGKSTLLNVIGLLDRPTAGQYLFDGREVGSLGDEEQARVRREKIGFVFQFFHLIPRLTAAENLELPLVLARTPSSERRDRVARTLEAVGIADRAHHRPDQLSGGQRQRVAIGRAMILEPSVILADEPTGNLDRASGSDIVRVLESLNDRGVALVVVTHDPELGQRARRRVRMVDGRVVGDDRDPGAPAGTAGETRAEP